MPYHYEKEKIFGETKEVHKEINEIINGEKRNWIRARHYSYIDFNEYGKRLATPDWFSMVRDPIERVRFIAW